MRRDGWTAPGSPSRNRHRGEMIAGTVAAGSSKRARDHARVLFGRFAAARQGRSSGDAAAESQYMELRNQLVLHHLNLVRYLARKYTNRGEAFDDLVQVGNMALVKAIDRYEIERGTDFLAYAVPTIIGEIKRHLRDKSWGVRVPRRLRGLSAAVGDAVERLGNELGRSPTVAELAADLGVDEDDILEAQDLGMSYAFNPLDSCEVGVRDPSLSVLFERLELARGAELLSARERLVIYLRFYRDLSQTTVADRLGVSQMQVSRIQQRALSKLRETLAETPAG